MKEISCTKCGLVNDYTVRKSELHNTAFCNGCGSYIKHLPKENKEFVIYFGKYKGTPLKEFTTQEHASWLKWAYNNCNLKKDLKEAILKHLG